MRSEEGVDNLEIFFQLYLCKQYNKAGLKEELARINKCLCEDSGCLYKAETSSCH